ncbi:MAG TPA: hypothetical protein VFK80_11020 [Limnochordia bacterium]|nr:hypothetical protein [Limnochordia bacterium]
MIKTIALQPQPWTEENVAALERRGLIQRFRPSAQLLAAEPGENRVEEVYVSAAEHGPHKLIAVAVNQHKVRLGVHPGREEILLPELTGGEKPCYYVVCLLDEAELRRRDAAGDLSADDFVCLSMFPNARGTEAFTVLEGALHCEATVPGPGTPAHFFVTEGRDLPLTWIDLTRHELVVAS